MNLNATAVTVFWDNLMIINLMMGRAAIFFVHNRSFLTWKMVMSVLFVCSDHYPQLIFHSFIIDVLTFAIQRLP